MAEKIGEIRDEKDLGLLDRCTVVIRTGTLEPRGKQWRVSVLNA